MRPANTKSKLANYMLDKFGDDITCTDSGIVLVLDGGMLLVATLAIPSLKKMHYLLPDIRAICTACH